MYEQGGIGKDKRRNDMKEEIKGIKKITMKQG